MRSFLIRSVVMGASITLACVCFSKARADIPYYSGDMAFKRQLWSEAFQSYELSYRRDRSNPNSLRQMGQAAYLAADAAGNTAGFLKAEEMLELVTQRMPYDAKSWVYLALARAARLQYSQTADKASWRQIQSLLENARRAEPGSPWVLYTAGKILLTQQRLLSEEDKSKAIDWIRQSVAVHNPYQSSPYLDSALFFLWHEFSDFRMLKLVTPADLFSYTRLINFVEAQGLWEYRDEINPYYLKLNENLYLEYCQQASYFLKKQDFKRAFSFYDRAVGVNNVRVHAKAGLLAVGDKLGELPRNWRKVLREILEEHDLDDQSLLQLEAVTQKSENPYLRGIFAYRKGDFDSARKYLEKADGQNKFRRQYLADAYWKLGEEEKALQIAKTVLEEKDPDLRELITYRTWESTLEKELSEKINQTATLSQSEQAWQGAGFDAAAILNHRGRMRVYLNLKPGGVVFRIKMRKKSDNKFKSPYAALHLWDGDKVYHLDSFYAPFKEWESKEFGFQTSGGTRALEMELMNGSALGEMGPVLELGAVEIEYPNA